MGKYTRKSKATGEVAVMDVAQSSLGVWTRAKKLALQRLQKSSVAAHTATATATATSVGRSYLQLRSRRLEKPLILADDSKRRKNILKDARVSNSSPSIEPNKSTKALNSRSAGSTLLDSLNEIQAETQKSEARDEDAGFEPCSDENVLESEGCCEREVRENTPCSLIKDIENTRRSPCSTNSSMEADTQRQNIPTVNEMEELFAGPEQQQQNKFIQKYNFDPVNEKPLPGRYEWEKLDL